MIRFAWQLSLVVHLVVVILLASVPTWGEADGQQKLTAEWNALPAEHEDAATATGMALPESFTGPRSSGQPSAPRLSPSEVALSYLRASGVERNRWRTPKAIAGRLPALPAESGKPVENGKVVGESTKGTRARVAFTMVATGEHGVSRGVIFLKRIAPGWRVCGIAVLYDDQWVRVDYEHALGWVLLNLEETELAACQSMFEIAGRTP